LLLASVTFLLQRTTAAAAAAAAAIATGLEAPHSHHHHRCVHDGLTVRTTTSEQDYDLFHSPQRGDEERVSEQQRRRLSSRLPLRIHAHYAFGDAPTALANSIETLLLPRAIKGWQAALSVTRTTSPLTFSRHCNLSYTDFSNDAPDVCAAYDSPTTCGGVVVPRDWLKPQRFCKTCFGDGTCSDCETYAAGAGVKDADLALLVTARDNGACRSSPSTLAWAMPCQRDQNNRPVLGVVNFCPSAMNGGSGDAWERMQIATAQHEIAHALGFTGESLGLMRDGDTNAPRTARNEGTGRPAKSSRVCSDGSARSVESPDSTTTLEGPVNIRGYATGYRLKTPAIRAVARHHYNCSTLAGAELENQPTGDSLSACWGSHWEQRALNTELMSPVTDSRSVLSSFTLAFFEDTGWYEANYSRAEGLTWGLRKGCSFLEEKCIDRGSGSPLFGTDQGYFCTASGQKGCTADRLSKGACGMTEYDQALPVPFQYFSSNAAKGGVLEELDYCPYIRAYSNGDCDDSANAPATNDKNYYGQIHGKGSSCVEGSLMRKEYVATDKVKPMCFGVACSADGSSATVTALASDGSTQVTVTCRGTDQGQSKPMPGGTDGPFSGFIICPDLSVVCSRANAFVPDVPSCPETRNLCHGHGSCPDGKNCVCVGAWTGDMCETKVSNTPSSVRGSLSKATGRTHGMMASTAVLVVAVVVAAVSADDAGFPIFQFPIP
jgi:hypothetical protein